MILTYFRQKSQSDSDSESEKNQSLIQSLILRLNQSLKQSFTAKCEMNRLWISTEGFLKNFLIQYWITLKVSYGLWKDSAENKDYANFHFLVISVQETIQTIYGLVCLLDILYELVWIKRCKMVEPIASAFFRTKVTSKQSTQSSPVRSSNSGSKKDTENSKKDTEKTTSTNVDNRKRRNKKSSSSSSSPSSSVKSSSRKGKK